jgi:flagellar biogenesis protein FliO
MIQTILVIIAFIAALAYLIRKFFGSTKKTSKACGMSNCGCE